MGLKAIESKYIKFMLCARRKREDTQERYFYEWGNIHVSLMLTTPEVMRVFKRYTQHYAISGVSSESLIYPLSAMEWDNMADHWLETYDDFVVALTDEGYAKRMQPHKFGDDAFELALCKGHLAYLRKGFRTGGGIKLVHWLCKKPEISAEDFNRRYLEEYAPAMTEALRGANLRKYVQNTPRTLDPERFKGTLFARGGVGKFAGVDEFWLESPEDLRLLRGRPAIYEAARKAAEPLIDFDSSFSIVTTERVVFDFATPNEKSPRPAILNPNSLEARVVAQGMEGWNQPRPCEDEADAKKRATWS